MGRRACHNLSSVLKKWAPRSRWQSQQLQARRHELLTAAKPCPGTNPRRPVGGHDPPPTQLRPPRRPAAARRRPAAARIHNFELLLLFAGKLAGSVAAGPAFAGGRRRARRLGGRTQNDGGSLLVPTARATPSNRPPPAPSPPNRPGSVLLRRTFCRATSPFGCSGSSRGRGGRSQRPLPPQSDPEPAPFGSLRPAAASQPSAKKPLCSAFALADCRAVRAAAAPPGRAAAAPGAQDRRAGRAYDWRRLRYGLPTAAHWPGAGGLACRFAA